MWPFALTTAARAWEGGPTIAIDLPGADAKVRTTTTASQPEATRAIAAVILPSGRSQGATGLSSVVIEVLDARASGLEVPADIDQTVNSSAKTCPAEAGPGIEIQRKQFRGVLDVQRRGLWSNHGDENLVVAGDLGKSVALI